MNNYPPSGRRIAVTQNKTFASSYRPSHAINGAPEAAGNSSNMVSETVLRNGPLSSHLNGNSSMNHSISNNVPNNIDNSIVPQSRLCLSLSSSSPFRRVCGVILASDRLPACRNMTCEKNCLAKCNRSSIVLGSIVIEKEVLTIDELRITLISQINTIPKNFTFLSKDG